MRYILTRTACSFNSVGELNFYSHDTSDFEKMLLNGDLDLFFGINARDLPEFRRIRIASEAAFLVVSADYLIEECRRSME